MRNFLVLHFIIWLIICLFMFNSLGESLIIFIWTYPLLLISFLLSIKLSKWLNNKFKFLKLKPIGLGAITFFLLTFGAYNIFALIHPGYSTLNIEFTSQAKIQEEEFKELLPNREGKYSLIYTQEEDDVETLTTQDASRGITEIEKSVYLRNLDDAQSKYPKLEIKKTPFYILLNVKGEVIFKSNSAKELEQFLMEN